MNRWSAVLVAALVAAPLSSGAVEQSKVSYSADYIMETADGAERGRIFVVPGKERRESVMEGMTTVFIRRDDLKKFWVLMPADRMYMDMKAGGPGKKTTDPNDFAVEMSEVGPEVLNGVKTTKHKVVMTGEGGKMGGFWWITADGIPVKMDTIASEKGEKMRIKRELSNIEIGPQPDELFEIPPGYDSMSMSLGKGMLGLPTGGDGDDGDDGAEEPAPKKKGFGIGRMKEALDKVR